MLFKVKTARRFGVGERDYFIPQNKRTKHYLYALKPRKTKTGYTHTRVCVCYFYVCRKNFIERKRYKSPPPHRALSTFRCSNDQESALKAHTSKRNENATSHAPWMRPEYNNTRESSLVCLPASPKCRTKKKRRPGLSYPPIAPKSGENENGAEEKESRGGRESSCAPAVGAGEGRGR